MIDASVLVLNKLFQPIHITTVRRAFCLLAKGHVRVVGNGFRTYDLAQWIAEEPLGDDGVVETPRRRVAAPRVVVLVDFDRLPRREVRFSRRNVYLRDGHRCQYCGRKGSSDDLNLDHVVPASRGGRSCWENVVASCVACNHRKQDRTPEEAGLRLLRRPERPRWHIFVGVAARASFHRSWAPFLPQIATA